jgi:Mg-chelatase subunit ChlD
MLEYEKENNIDVVIVMDTTGSMAAYLEQAKIDSINIMKMFK